MLISRFFKLFVVLFICSQVRAQADSVRLKELMTVLTKTNVARNYRNLDQLNATADYIYYQFSQFADTVYYQEFKVKGITYKNVIAGFGIEKKDRIIIGAHYDVCGNQEGADDNASGVSGLIELARLLKDSSATKRIDLVAYTLEEPPFFATEYMGSYVHAKSLSEDSVTVFGMISLEMIGYFDSAKKSQKYPLRFLSWFYGNKGNYITVVNKFGRGNFARSFTKRMKKNGAIDTKNFQGPQHLTGIDFSDHRSYWKFGYSAVMITDTAFYRNKNYHQTSDTMGTLDYTRMKEVVDEIYTSLLTF
jgi:hypothetical protein